MMTIPTVANEMNFLIFNGTLLEKVPDLYPAIHAHIKSAEKANKLAIRFLNDYLIKKDIQIEPGTKYIPAYLNKSIKDLINNCSAEAITLLQKVCKYITAIHVNYVEFADSEIRKSLYRKKIEELIKEEIRYPLMGRCSANPFILPLQTFQFRSETEQEILHMYTFDQLLMEGKRCKKELK